MSSEATVFETMREILANALGVDEEEVELDSCLTADLGAESIDFLDISFQLEEKYDLVLPTKEWTELFSSSSGQLPMDELTAIVQREYGIELADGFAAEHAEQPLGKILDAVESHHGIRIDEQARWKLAEAGTRSLLEGLGDLLLSPVSEEVRQEVIAAATRCGFDEHFWQTLSRAFTVRALVEFVERRTGGERAVA